MGNNTQQSESGGVPPSPERLGSPVIRCGNCQRWTRRSAKEGKCSLYDMVVTPPGEPREFGITEEHCYCKYAVAVPDLFDLANTEGQTRGGSRVV